MDFLMLIGSCLIVMFGVFFMGAFLFYRKLETMSMKDFKRRLAQGEF